MSAPKKSLKKVIKDKLKLLIHPKADLEFHTSALIGKYLAQARRHNIKINLSKLVEKAGISADENYYILCYGCQKDAEKVDEGKRKAGLK